MSPVAPSCSLFVTVSDNILIRDKKRKIVVGDGFAWLPHIFPGLRQQELYASHLSP
jgi:hypothetical protein